MDITEGIDYFLTRKEAEDLSRASLDQYGRALYAFATWMEDRGKTDMEAVTVFHVSAYMKHLRDRHEAGELASASVATYLRPLKVFCRFALHDKPPFLHDDPFAPGSLKIPKVKKQPHYILTDAEIRALLNACDLITHEGRRDYAIICFLLDTGVRVSELTGTKVSDIDVKGRSCKVTGKGDKTRTVYFSAQTAAALTRYTGRMPAKFKSPTWYWTSIRRHSGQQITPNGVAQMLIRRAAVANVTGRVNPHTFRHTFATKYLRAGGDLNSLMRLMGHFDIVVTQIYLSLLDEDLKVKHDQFSPLAASMGRR